MHFFHRIAYCFLLVLMAVHVPARPAKDILKPAHTIWPPEDHDENVIPHGKSKITWDCRWRYKFLWYEVDLSGHNWGKSEAAIKLAVQEAAHEAMTKWKYTEFKGEGLDEFDANVSGFFCFFCSYPRKS